MPINQRCLPIAGLATTIYSSDVRSDASRPTAVVFLLHGRLSNAKRVEEFAFKIMRDYEEKAVDETKQLLIVTFDQRNHGTRLLSKQANWGWNESPDKHNDKHAVDMYATQTGTARDVSFLIDFLPAYLTPAMNITSWGVIGISLGGHSAWILLRNEPRISLGVPIIGCPDYISLMQDRARRYRLPIDEKYFPSALKQYVAKHDPINSPYDSSSPDTNPFYGKHILVLSGEKDELVPWEFSQPFVDRLVVGPLGLKRVFLQPDVGHTNSPEMQTEASRFIWIWISS